MSHTFATQRLFQLDFFSQDKKILENLLQDHLRVKKDLLTIATPNPEQVVLSQENTEFLQAFQAFDIRIPDGQGIVWASGVFGQKLSERIPGIEVVEFLLKQVDQGKVLIIGGRGYGEAADIKHKVLSISELDVNGTKVLWTPGYEDVSRPSEQEEEIVVQTIKKLQPSVVFVAFGAPHQESWLISHKKILEESKVAVAMVVGGAFDMILGKVARAPQLVQNMGLEWLFRLIQEPWRWRRQLKLIRFIQIVLQEKFTVSS